MHVVVSTWRGLKVVKKSRPRCTLPASAALIGPAPAPVALKKGKKGVKYEATINEDTQSLSNMVATKGLLKWERLLPASMSKSSTKRCVANKNIPTQQKVLLWMRITQECLREGRQGNPASKVNNHSLLLHVS